MGKPRNPPRPADADLDALIQPEGVAPSAGGEPVLASEGDGSLTGDGSGRALPPIGETEPAQDRTSAALASAIIVQPTYATVPVPPKTAWLTAAASEAFGAAGRFVDLTEDEAKAAPAGLLVAPTAEQLALRVR